MVLDLRGNGGGMIQPAVEVADLFLDSGVILHETRRDGVTTFDAHSGGAGAALPLAVLINGSTASAAEIVAGAIQAHERGSLVGERTYGKGSVQLIFVLSDGSSLHVTAALWLLPDHRPIDPEGLIPDIAVARTDEGQDDQLDRAVHYLQTSE
jgi:carboxyl-terminal processing protease